MASSAKLTVISSATGLSPPMAAPTETPMIVFSEMGVSLTRSSPNSASRPLVTLNEPSYRATSSPSTNTDGSRRISSFNARFKASLYVISDMGTLQNLAFHHGVTEARRKAGEEQLEIEKFLFCSQFPWLEFTLRQLLLLTYSVNLPVFVSPWQVFKRRYHCRP